VAKALPAPLFLHLLGAGSSSDVVDNTTTALLDLALLAPSLVPREVLTPLLQLLVHPKQGGSVRPASSLCMDATATPPPPQQQPGAQGGPYRALFAPLQAPWSPRC